MNALARAWHRDREGGGGGKEWEGDGASAPDPFLWAFPLLIICISFISGLYLFHSIKVTKPPAVLWLNLSSKAQQVSNSSLPVILREGAHIFWRLGKSMITDSILPIVTNYPRLGNRWAAKNVEQYQITRPYQPLNMEIDKWPFIWISTHHSVSKGIIVNGQQLTIVVRLISNEN